MGIEVKLLFTWQLAQVTVVCAPVNGNGGLEWSKEAGTQPLVEWQTEQSVGNPALRWFGFVVALNWPMWQEAQAVGVPANLPLMWQLAHGTVMCNPVSGNGVLL